MQGWQYKLPNTLLSIIYLWIIPNTLCCLLDNSTATYTGSSGPSTAFCCLICGTGFSEVDLLLYTQLQCVYYAK